MKQEVNDKYDAIIEAAIRRFSHFGFQKTTMTEIAEDVSISKQALAYYFTDKQSLMQAVAGQIIQKYLHDVESCFKSASSIEVALSALCDIKKSHFERYYMLYLQTSNADLKAAQSELTSFKLQVRTKEVALVATLLERSVANGEIAPTDVQKTSALLLDTLFAFECAVKLEKVLPDQQDFTDMIKKQKNILHLFVNGLKHNGAKT